MGRGVPSSLGAADGRGRIDAYNQGLTVSTVSQMHCDNDDGVDCVAASQALFDNPVAPCITAFEGVGTLDPPQD